MNELTLQEHVLLRVLSCTPDALSAREWLGIFLTLSGEVMPVEVFDKLCESLLGSVNK